MEKNILQKNIHIFLQLNHFAVQQKLTQYGKSTIIQEAGQVVWYSHLFQNFPQFVVIHIVKAFSIVSEAEVDVFLEFSCFLYKPVDVGNLISGSSAFSKASLNIWKFTVHIVEAWLGEF